MSDGDLKLGLFDLPEFGALLDPSRRPRKNQTKPVWSGKGRGGARGKAAENRPAPLPGAASEGRAARLLRIAKRTPEAFVKITGTNAEASPLIAHLRYLASHSKDPIIEDQDGNRLEPTLEGRRELLEQWSLAVTEGRRQEAEWLRKLAALKELAETEGREFVEPEPGPRRTIALHIVLSMPPGTPAMPVLQAARAFAAAELHNHRHILVLHRDKDHPHVHVVVNNIGHDLRPLSRDREDLQRWREVFARELRALGVEAEATPRKARGVIRKRENRRLTMVKEKASVTRDLSQVHVWRSKVAQASREVHGDTARVVHPAEQRARQNRAMLEEGMRDAIVRLREQGDQGSQAAVMVADFLSKLPPRETEMDELRRTVAAVKDETLVSEKNRRPPPEMERG